MRISTDTRGTAALEFAIIAPVFILIVMGMIAYAIYFGASHSIQQIAADAARSAIAGLDEGERRSLASGFVARNADGYTFVDPARLAVEVRDSDVDPNQFVVELRYDARDLPIWNLLVDLPLPDMTIARRSTIRLGGL
jgi:Flp pilus assembly protein TadG